MQVYKHLWRLLACVLFTIASVGCGNPNEDPPLFRVLTEGGFSPYYRPTLKVVNCIPYQELLVFQYEIYVVDELTITNIEVRVRSYDQNFDQIIPFPALRDQLPLTRHPEQDPIIFEGVWDQAGYPIPDPIETLQGIFLSVEAHYTDSTGAPHVATARGYIGVEFYTYSIAGGDVKLNVRCSDMEKMDL